MPNIYRVPVGPGTGVKTKGNVSGDLLVPKFFIDELKKYAYSMQRLRRQALASETNRHLLLLTNKGNPYVRGSLNRLMTELRRDAMAAGLRFMQSFKFHQTRATYGTWLMDLALMVAPKPSVAIGFVRDAMLHKDERTTWLYVKFHEQMPLKAKLSNEFSAAFTGVENRDWSQYRA